MQSRRCLWAFVAVAIFVPNVAGSTPWHHSKPTAKKQRSLLAHPCAALPDCPDPVVSPPSPAICPSLTDPARRCRYPLYNTVYQTGTHNSYWKNIYPTSERPDFYASGAQSSILDQLLHNHV